MVTCSSQVWGSQRFKYDNRPVLRVGAFSAAAPQIVMYEVAKPKINMGLRGDQSGAPRAKPQAAPKPAEQNYGKTETLLEAHFHRA